MTLANNFVLIPKKDKSFSKVILALGLLGLCLTAVDARNNCGLKCFSFKKCMGQLDGGNRPGQLGNTGQLVLNQCDAGGCDCAAIEAEKNKEQEKPRSSEVKEEKEDERDHRFLLKQRPSFRVRGTFRRPSPSSSSSDTSSVRTSTSVKTSTSSKSSRGDARSRRKTSGFTPRKPVSRFGKSKPSASKAKESETIEELKKAWAKEKEELLALIAKYRKALGIDLEEKEQTRPRFGANRRSGSRFVPRRF